MSGVAGQEPVPDDVRADLDSVASGSLSDSYQTVQPGTEAGDAILEMYSHVTDALHAETAGEALASINDAYVAGNSRLETLESRDSEYLSLVQETLQKLDGLARRLE